MNSTHQPIINFFFIGGIQPQPQRSCPLQQGSFNLSAFTIGVQKKQKKDFKIFLRSFFANDI